MNDNSSREQRYSELEIMNTFPDKFILLYDVADDGDGLARGFLKGAYNTRDERATAIDEIPEENRGVIGLVEGINLIDNVLGGIL